MRTCLLLLAVLAAELPAHAQQLPTIEELLPRVTAYVQQYRRSVPSLEVDESAVTQQVNNDRAKWEVRLEMTLRVLRDESNPNGFVDRYTFRIVDGKPPKNHFKLPYFVQGVFSNAIGLARPEQQSCFEYRVSPGDTAATAKIDMWVKPGPLRPNCKEVFEDYRKTVVVDVGSGAILRVTRSMSPKAARDHHDAVFISLDYAPQKLGDATFCLPVRFESHDEKNEGRMTATFSNFHRYTSTAKMVNTGSQPQVTP
jgi:hypothetical protein